MQPDGFTHLFGHFREGCDALPVGLERDGLRDGGRIEPALIGQAVQVAGIAPGSALAALRTPVDAFFDGVMVNADDAALRANRLALLRGLHAAMNRVADLARLAS